MGWDEMRLHEMGLSGMGWDGMCWDGVGWDGVGGGRMGCQASIQGQFPSAVSLVGRAAAHPCALVSLSLSGYDCAV